MELDQRRSSRLNTQEENEMRKYLAAMPILHYDGSHIIDPSKNRRKFKEIKRWNKIALAHKPNIPAWNENILHPSANPILDYYEPNEFSIDLIKEKQRVDTMTYAIIHFIKTDNTNLLKDVPDYYRKKLTNGKFLLDEHDILRFIHDNEAKIVIPWQLKKSLFKKWSVRPCLSMAKSLTLVSIQL